MKKKRRPCIAHWHATLLLAGALAAGSAGAQVSGSVVLATDYRFRGVSLSANQPALQADLGYDHPSGWFGGLFASTVRLYEPGTLQGQAVVYAGDAVRLDGGWSLDGGLSYAAFTDATVYDYGELHAGLTTPAGEARLSYAPNYFGRGVATVYVEFNGAQALFESPAEPAAARLRLVWHGGLLQRTSGTLRGKPGNVDARAGLELAQRGWRWQVARVFSQNPPAAYPVQTAHPHGDWLATLSYSF